MKDSRTMYHEHGPLITFIVVLLLLPVWIAYFVYLLVSEVARENMSPNERRMFRQEKWRREHR